MPNSARHHPEGEFLFDYASGGAPQSVALLIATHLALCPECRRAVRAFEGLAGASMEAGEDAGLGAASLDLNTLPRQNAPHAAAATNGRRSYVFPEPLRSYAGGDADDLSWRSTIVGTKEIVLPNADGHEVKLVQLPHRSLVMPAHTHGGSELMLVLHGAFKDSTGRYERGDVSTGDPSLTHRPIAVGRQRCICLTVVDAPLRAVGMRAKAFSWWRRRTANPSSR